MAKNLESGALTEAVFYILLVLHKPLHGYGMMQVIGEMTNGRMHLGAGTLYGAINSLLEKKWIEAVSGEDSRKKEYVITELGKEVVQMEIIRLQELLDNGRRIVEGRL